MGAAAGKLIRASLVCPALPVKPLLLTLPQPRPARQLQPAALPVVLRALLATQRIWARSLTLPMPKHPLPARRRRLPALKPLLAARRRNPKTSRSNSSNRRKKL